MGMLLNSHRGRRRMPHREFARSFSRPSSPSSTPARNLGLSYQDSSGICAGRGGASRQPAVRTVVEQDRGWLR